MNLEGPTRKPRHASVVSTHSDTQAVPAFRKILLVSVKFLSAILGPEMAVPTFGRPAFCKKTSMSIKFLVWGGYFGLGGGVPILFIFMGAGIFLTHSTVYDCV